MIGQTLSHYEVLDLLGSGGMGDVYRARDTKLGREVAIKVLPEEFTADPERLARFEREAKRSVPGPTLRHCRAKSVVTGIHRTTGSTETVS